jgi:hypothetical protein
MKVVGLLFGLIVDGRWFHSGTIFSDVSWDSVLWWFIGILVFFFVFAVVSFLLRLVFSRVTDPLDSWFPGGGIKMRNRLQTWADDQSVWLFPAAAFHYVITLALWRDTESLLLAWLHLVVFAVFLMDRKVRQLLQLRAKLESEK